jgi:hypothetical protein
MTLMEIIDRFGDLLNEPRIPRHERLQPVDGYAMQFSRTTLAESERMIRENPQLAREMGVTLEDLK